MWRESSSTSALYSQQAKILRTSPKDGCSISGIPTLIYSRTSSGYIQPSALRVVPSLRASEHTDRNNKVYTLLLLGLLRRSTVVQISFFDRTATEMSILLERLPSDGRCRSSFPLLSPALLELLVPTVFAASNADRYTVLDYPFRSTVCCRSELKTFRSPKY